MAGAPGRARHALPVPPPHSCAPRCRRTRGHADDAKNKTRTRMETVEQPYGRETLQHGDCLVHSAGELSGPCPMHGAGATTAPGQGAPLPLSHVRVDMVGMLPQRCPAAAVVHGLHLRRGSAASQTTQGRIWRGRCAHAQLDPTTDGLTMEGVMMHTGRQLSSCLHRGLHHTCLRHGGQACAAAGHACRRHHLGRRHARRTHATLLSQTRRQPC